MKKYIYPAITAFVGALIFGVAEFFKLLAIGASDCDVMGKSFDCFCCNSFGLRGYESCGDYGFLAGAGVGAIVGLIIYAVVKKIYRQKNNYENK